jgi:hypothetical protein
VVGADRAADPEVIVSRFSHCIFGLALVSGLCVPAAKAGAVINFVQSGPNVMATGSGTLNTTALTNFGLVTNGTGALNATYPYAMLGAPVVNGDSIQTYISLAGPSTFGTGGYFMASSGSGSVFGLYAGGQLGVPGGYVSGSALSSVDLWTGTTLASLGLTPGSYVYSWGTPGVNFDTLTINVGSVVPEPGSLSLIILGCAGLLVRRNLGLRARDSALGK